MALTGTWERSIDSKGRLAIPKPLKEAFEHDGSDELFLAPGNEGCLSVYAPEQFERYAAQLASASRGEATVRNFLRLFYARAERVVPDKQHRIRIPDRLARHASLSGNVVIVGVYDHAEIWDLQQWEQFLAEHSSQFDRLTTEALERMVRAPMDGSPATPENSES